MSPCSFLHSWRVTVSIFCIDLSSVSQIFHCLLLCPAVKSVFWAVAFVFIYALLGCTGSSVLCLDLQLWWPLSSQSAGSGACRVSVTVVCRPSSCGSWLAGFPGGSDSQDSACNRESQVQSLGQEDPLRKEWVPTPLFLPGESHGQQDPGGPQSLELQRAGRDWVTNTFTLSFPFHVESYQTTDQTHVPCPGRWILNHWTSREVLLILDFSFIFL